MRTNKKPRGRCRVCKEKMVIEGKRYIDGVKKYVYACPLCHKKRVMNRRMRWADSVDLIPRENHPLKEHNDYKKVRI